ncbi:heme transporter CcmC [Alkalihalobacillus alcalophilus ATCC 27647 = CGMCC 1.3604]|uniref:Heme response regulator HssR n=1 Tax=Alkalihalobacillus alcalophilus ATCC 27647 = CGMCC 1.3604 TaxID=1218173 RepID=A0A094WMQ9_ALKAL|nr:response regulator transcription factor [Alkalihalobacillus alcalophilus]KGA98151.1 heme transporter CcmC [Alkalihalobacillus alcalophilus ATCC 27647 = CGMCC 1.3604]MED1560856.1 response regulator transcription factor [Alkalihalobacillus alcalophilus]THG91929.1 heme transporter CcmC [Alkalihalobacillus alcalophilus ATCC 27647 = CGMCC 1.3604]
MQSILIVDDDKHLRQMVSQYLEENGYRTGQAENGEVALHLLEQKTYQLVVIDVMMPIMDGYELVKQLRHHQNIPVIMLTAKSQLHDKEKGFALGTDDYLVKPFELKELLFRIKALLRRSRQESELIIQIGAVTINKVSYEVEVHGQTFMLPLKEFELLYVLAANKNRVLTRDQLIEKVWGHDFSGNERTIDVHIKRLRERFTKMTTEITLKTIRGVGYSLEVIEE